MAGPTNGCVQSLEADLDIQSRHYMDTPYVEESYDARSRVEEGQCGAIDSISRRGSATTRLRDFQTHRATLLRRRSLLCYLPLSIALSPGETRRDSGRWVEKSGQRRRRYHRLTSKGQEVLASQRRGWQAFVEAVNRITDAEHA